jgi:hypothetical protein
LAVAFSALAGAAEPARVTVEISPPERAAEVVKVQALDRNLPQKMVDKEVRIRTVEAKPVEGTPGKWLIEGLAPGLYDLCVETKKGKFEGCSLRPDEQSDEALTAEDREKITGIADGIKTYEDEKRILDIGGNGKKAVALVELIRRGPTSDKPGIVTWRVELWRFEKLYGVWRRGDPKVLRRFRIETAREFAAWNWSFVPELGGLELKAGEQRELKWNVPDKFDPARGRAAGAAAESRTPDPGPKDK